MVDFILFILMFITHSNSFCIHDMMQKEMTASFLTPDKGKNFNHKIQRRSTGSLSRFQPIRIHTEYANLEIELFDNEILVLKKTLEGVISKITQILSVIPEDKPLLLSRVRACHKMWSDGENKGRCSEKTRYYHGEKCMMEFMIPDNHLDGLSVWNKTGEKPISEEYTAGAGINLTDYVLYVQALTTHTCRRYKGNSVMAYATHCHQDSTGRPISGYINVCPHQLKLESQASLYKIVLHEVFHALGFSKKLFPSFKKCSVEGKNSECEKYGSSLFRQINGIFRMVSPSVVHQVQQLSGCLTESKFGGPMQSKDGKVSSHWDSLLMFGSIMAPSVYEAHLTILDPITLSVFEDSGWYKVNYDEADKYYWGKGAGCLFGIGDCANYPKFFCNESEMGCHYLHTDKARCTKMSHNHKCSIFIPEENGSCLTNNDISKLEINKISSLCLINKSTEKIPNSTTSEETYKGKCYQSRCVNAKIQVKVADFQWVTCPFENSLKIHNYTGEIQCPSDLDILCLHDDVFSTRGYSKSVTDVVTVPAKTHFHVLSEAPTYHLNDKIHTCILAVITIICMSS